MTNRCLGLALAAIAFSLGSCSTPPDRASRDLVEPGAIASPSSPEQPTVEAPENSTGSPSVTNGVANDDTDIDNSAAQPSTSPDSSLASPQKASAGLANLQETPPETTPKTPPENSVQPSTASPAAISPKSTEQPDPTDLPITINESVCGAGGQEAYFETKTQEIYICKNDAAALTYIATPKKQGNSQFLPAQKVQQGDITGYIALDNAKTYIITPGGFQLQDGGKTQQSEKVIRRQLAKQ